jgi:hypothetical protein
MPKAVDGDWSLKMDKSVKRDFDSWALTSRQAGQNGKEGVQDFSDMIGAYL